MTEKELIQKIQELRDIRPRQDWVVLTKKQILGSEPSYREKFSAILEVFPLSAEALAKAGRLLFQPKLAFATLIILGVLISSFSFAQNSLPGDFFYPLKKMTEKTQAIFASQEQKPKLQLELVNKRLEELNKIAETNQVKNLTPALNELQANISQAAKEIIKTKKLDVKEIVQQTKKLEETKQKVEALGVVIGGTEELDNALAQLVEQEIKDLGTRTLTENQEKLLTEAKENFEANNFSEALEKIWLLSNQP